MAEVPATADVVVIGAGIVGNSLVHHLTRLGWKNVVAPLTSMAMSAASRHLSAVHMTWGAVNEWTTQAGYARVIAREPHPARASCAAPRLDAAVLRDRQPPDPVLYEDEPGRNRPAARGGHGQR